MFRSRFAEAFPKHVPNVGPQDIEFGVASPEPSEQVEQLLCGLLGLVLNRKKYVEYAIPLDPSIIDIMTQAMRSRSI